MIIENGGIGAKIAARVDEEHRLHIHAHSEEFKNHRGKEGHAYNINTGSVTLTGSATTSAVLYIKNNEDQTLVIPKLIYIIGNSTSGTGDMTITVIRNPSTGTIISGATNVSIASNRNFSKNNTLGDSLIYKGAEGNTFTDGSDSIFTIYSDSGFRDPITVGDIILPKGASIGVEITTQSSNSSMNVAIAVEAYLRSTSD